MLLNDLGQVLVYDDNFQFRMYIPQSVTAEHSLHQNTAAPRINKKYFLI